MSTDNLVPSEIDAIITAKVQSVRAEQEARAEAERQEKETLTAQGKAMFEAAIENALTDVPEYMYPYLDHETTHRDVDYHRIGHGWDQHALTSVQLYFQVPGLTLIIYESKSKQWKWQTAHPSESHWNEDGYIFSEPYVKFSGSNYDWSLDLEYVLAAARKQRTLILQYINEYAAAEEERAKELERERVERQEKNARKQQEAESARLAQEAESQREQAEEQALFEAIKSDPIAIHLLKAFVLLRDERSSFSQQLENADWALYNMEERHSRRAEELRRQADEIERRAEDERYRLQSDLDDAEAKLKKAERGW